MSAKRSFTYAAIALALGSLLHIIGLILGPDAIAFLGAPDEFVQMLRDGDWVWPVFVTLAITGLLAGLAWLSWRTRPPKASGVSTRAILWVFAVIFTLRGLMVGLFVPAIMARKIGDPLLFGFHVGASIVVLTIGAALAYGLYKTRKLSR